MINTPHDRLERHPDYQWYCEERILGEYATEEEAIEGARKKMVQMGQFQGWADDETSEYILPTPHVTPIHGMKIYGMKTSILLLRWRRSRRRK
jgi:hypothetical protein